MKYYDFTNLIKSKVMAWQQAIVNTYKESPKSLTEKEKLKRKKGIQKSAPPAFNARILVSTKHWPANSIIIKRNSCINLAGVFKQASTCSSLIIHSLWRAFLVILNHHLDYIIFLLFQLVQFV